MASMAIIPCATFNAKSSSLHPLPVHILSPAPYFLHQWRLHNSIYDFMKRKIEVKAQHQWRVNSSVKSQDGASSRNSGRRVWRRRQLSRKDEHLEAKMERVPFLEEQVRKMRETGELVSGDIARLLLSEDNRYEFVNEVAAEAKQYVDNRRDEYGAKKAILHVLSNGMNDAGFYRREAYKEEEPFKPDPGYVKQDL